MLVKVTCAWLRMPSHMDLGFSCLRVKPQAGFVHIFILRTWGILLGFCFSLAGVLPAPSRTW